MFLTPCFRAHIFDDADAQPLGENIFAIRSGDVRIVNLDGPDALWRRFGELVLDDGSVEIDDPADREPQVWLAMHGDPLAVLGDDSATRLNDWKRYVEAFAIVAQAWDAPDADGASRLTADPARLAAAQAALESLPRPAVRMTRDFRVEAETHVSHMAISAAIHLRDGAIHARCQFCKGWFHRTHALSKFCSQLCRQRMNFGKYIERHGKPKASETTKKRSHTKKGK